MKRKKKYSRDEQENILTSLLNNNGYFRTAKQADYFLEIADTDGILESVGGDYYGNVWGSEYKIDNQGIVSIHKIVRKRGVLKKRELTWERRVLGSFTIQDDKKLEEQLALREKLLIKLELTDEEIDRLEEFKRYANKS